MKRSERRHSIAATASAIPILLVVAVQAVAFMGSGLATWADWVHAYAPLAATATGLGLAIFLAWKVPGLREARMLNWVLVFFALNTTLAVWPFESGWLASAWVRIATAFWPMLWIRFTMVFPRELTVADTDRMLATATPTGWGWRLRGSMLRTLRYVIVHPWTWYAWAGVWVAQFVASLYAGTMEYRPSVGFVDVAPSGFELDPVISPVLVRITGLLTLVVTAFVSASFLWVGYRSTNERARGRILAVVLASMFIAGWVLGFLALSVSTRLTGSPVLFGIASAYATLLYPVLWMAGLAGLGASVLISGAFDLRPMVRRTGLYALLFVIATFLFAGIEEFVEAQLATRFGVEGLGLWIGAGCMALVIGPLHHRLDRFVQQAGLREVPKPQDLERS